MSYLKSSVLHQLPIPRKAPDFVYQVYIQNVQRINICAMWTKLNRSSDNCCFGYLISALARLYKLRFLTLISDIDECAVNNGNCSPFANCTNILGSYNCTCMTGFSGDGFNCTGELWCSYLFICCNLLSISDTSTIPCGRPICYGLKVIVTFYDCFATDDVSR